MATISADVQSGNFLLEYGPYEYFALRPHNIRYSTVHLWGLWWGFTV